MSMPKLRFKDNDESEFPDWQKKNIGEILTIGSGKDYKHLSTGNVPVFGTGGYMLSVNDYLYDGESVCIGRKGTIDKPALLNGKFWTVDTLFYTHSFKNSIPKFVYAIFQRIDWKNHNEASGVPSLSKSTIEKINIQIPSISEQTKIANFLTAVDEKTTQLTQKTELLAQYKKGVMQKIFSQELRFKNDDGSEFPEWEESTLGEIGKFKSGTGFPDSEQGGTSGIPFYKVSDMNLAENKLEMLLANNYVSEDQINKLKLKVINDEAIVFAKVGAAIFLERKRKAKNFLIDNNMMAFIPTCDINFIKQFMDSIRLSKFAQVGALPSYNASDLSIIEIAVPVIKEQTKIANFLSAIDDKITQTQSQLDAVKHYKQGLLQQMFV
jgi:type I restriction enzyme, S subunit